VAVIEVFPINHENYPAVVVGSLQRNLVFFKATFSFSLRIKDICHIKFLNLSSQFDFTWILGINKYLYSGLLRLEPTFKKSSFEFEIDAIIEINEVYILLYFDAFGIRCRFALPYPDLHAAREGDVDVYPLDVYFKEIVKTLHIDLIIVIWFLVFNFIIIVENELVQYLFWIYSKTRATHR